MEATVSYLLMLQKYINTKQKNQKYFTKDFNINNLKKKKQDKKELKFFFCCFNPKILNSLDTNDI